MFPTHNTDILVDTLNTYQGNPDTKQSIPDKQERDEGTNCGNSKDTALQTKYLHELRRPHINGSGCSLLSRTE